MCPLELENTFKLSLLKLMFSMLGLIWFISVFLFKGFVSLLKSVFIEVNFIKKINIIPLKIHFFNNNHTSWMVFMKCFN